MTTLALFLSHGAIFLSLRTEGELMERARRVAGVASGVTVALITAFLIWTTIDQSGPGGLKVSALVLAVLAVALAAAVPAAAHVGVTGARAR